MNKSSNAILRLVLQVIRIIVILMQGIRKNSVKEILFGHVQILETEC